VSPASPRASGRARAARYRRYDRDLDPVADLGRQVIQKPYVLAIDVDVHEAAQFSLVVAHAGAESGIAPVELLDYVSDAARFNLNRIDVSRQSPERRWYQHIE
jgi:hypothetical protein